MSSALISRNPDLARLRDEGYEVQIKAGHLVVSHIPYVTSAVKVAYGTLVSLLEPVNDHVVRQKDHVASFIGEQPCHKDGTFIGGLQNDVGNRTLASDLVVNRSFSNKPNGGYADHHAKVTRYVTILTAPAQALDPTATAQTYKVIDELDEDSPFVYFDSNSSRAQINMISAKLTGQRIALVGLGGTGSYVLDLVAKTRVKEIHLFDGDFFHPHNAFRAPGAAAREVFDATSTKVDYFKAIYSRMHKGVVGHPEFLSATNISQLNGFQFVFLSMDAGENKQNIVEFLVAHKIPFVDSGLGVLAVDDRLQATVRATTVTPEKHDHVSRRISFHVTGDDDYATNIQIAELNMLNAVMAVVKWKKLAGFYADLEREHHSTYTLDGSMLLNEETHP